MGCCHSNGNLYVAPTRLGLDRGGGSAAERQLHGRNKWHTTKPGTRAMKGESGSSTGRATPHVHHR